MSWLMENVLWFSELICIYIACAFVGKGIHGKGVDDHPICPYCKYDLHGHHVDLRVVKNRWKQKCPECGEKFWGNTKSIIVGHKVRNWRLVWVGLLFAVVFVLAFHWHDIVTSQPTLLPNRAVVKLVADSEADYFTVHELSEEIVIRLDNGELDQGAIDLLVDRLLENAEKRELPWYSGWRSLLIALDKNGHLSIEDQKRWVKADMGEGAILFPDKVSNRQLDQVRLVIVERDGGLIPNNREGNRHSDRDMVTGGFDYMSWRVMSCQLKVNDGDIGEEIVFKKDEMRALLRGNKNGKIVALSEKSQSDIKRLMREGENELILSMQVAYDGADPVYTGFTVWVDSEPITFANVGDELAGAELIEDKGKVEKVKEAMLPCSRAAIMNRNMRRGEAWRIEPCTKVFAKGRETVFQSDEYEEMLIDDGLFLNFVMVGEAGMEHVNDKQFVMFEEIDEPMCYEVVLRVDGIEYKQEGHVYFEPKEGLNNDLFPSDGMQRDWTWDGEVFELPEGVKGRKGDVILRAEPGYANNVLHMKEILGGEIIYKDVYFLHVPNHVERLKWRSLGEKAKWMLVEDGVHESMKAIDELK
ncbi:hypothetical protein JD969_05015 [Planctomycetota bacterium]|nr:hypothetical protein JD969_05015 [Planctomycetota bacterium]